MNTLTIVVTYNRKELLKECIEALKNQKNATTDILIIDNCSTDGTEEMIKSHYSKDVTYENTGANLGGAGGFNYGIKKAFSLEKKYDYLWIMDDDTIPTETALYEILEVAKSDKDFGFISPKTLWIDSSLCLMNIQSDKKNKLINSSTEDKKKLSRCSFVACFINVQAILKVGLPISKFFIWADDTEYTQRISKYYDCYYAAKSIVVHKMGTNNSVRIETDVENRIERYFYLYRNRFYIAKRNGILKVLHYHGSILKNIFRVLVFSKNHRFKRLKSIFKGYWSGLFFDPEIEFIKQ